MASSETKHTPGPWNIDSMKAGSWFVSTGNDWSVCSRLSTVEHMEQQSYANARLIAAAPELLAALKILCDDDASYHGNEIRIACNSHGEAIERLRIARAAIAKATS